MQLYSTGYVKGLRKKLLRDGFTIVGLVIITAYYLTSVVELSKIVAVIQQSNPLWLVAAISIFYGSIVMRGLRWRAFLSSASIQMSFKNTMYLYSNGQFLNLFLPMKLGDIYRGAVTGQMTDGNTSKVIGTIASERIVDLALLTIGIAIFAPIALSESGGLHLIAKSILAVGFIISIGLAASYYISKNLDSVSYLQKVASAFIEGIRSATSSFKQQWVLVPTLTVSIWMTNVVRLLFVLEALQLQIPIVSVFFIALLLGLASGLPYVPSGVGVFELLGSQALISVGLSGSEAVAVVLIERAINTVSFIIVGGLVYGYTKTKTETQIDLKELVASAKKLRD